MGRGTKVGSSRVTRTELGTEHVRLWTYEVVGCGGIVLGGRTRDGDGRASDVRNGSILHFFCADNVLNQYQLL